MAYDYSETALKQAQIWANSAANAGWISLTMVGTLSEDTLSAPESLFKTEQAKPLIVAFMGGTGVGKSSLLNRLAGKPIAIAGIERPTSKEVTLYHHQSLVMSTLPASLPLQKIRVTAHDDLAYKQLVWLDMPDFDSTERQNQDLVLEWLPYIDVLIYVVSPERYRDNKAWQLLLAEGNRHAWLFVLNQWDKGFTEQYIDFKKQLQLAGFDNPLVFKTDCSLTLVDEFNDLQQTLTDLASDHTVEYLAARGAQVRQQALTNRLQVIAGNMGSTQAFETLLKQWPLQWEKAVTTLQKGFAWPIQLQANQFADQQSSATKYLSNTDPVLWDEWAQNRLNDVLDELTHGADDLKLPLTPIKTPLLELRNKAGSIVSKAIGLEVRQSLANPGSGLQKFLLRLTYACEIILPACALGFVGYTVFQGYYQSNLTHQNYLGVDFAVHSALFVGLSWLVPFFMRKKLKPSLQKAAIKGLQNGLAKGLSEIDYNVTDMLENVVKQRLEYIQQLDQLMQAYQSDDTTVSKVQEDSTLGRMLTSKI